MLGLSQRQIKIKDLIEKFSTIFNIDPAWATAIAMVESNLGKYQVSRTNCYGVFQMSSIAMKDLRQEMKRKGESDLIDIACGCAFLHLLLKRWGSYKEATLHFCDPKDRSFYLDRVEHFMKELNET